ncbi:MAG TPA: RNA polymerase sigma factor [Gemmatimonadaceae bacterium]|jgi:RNA polymerase sigma-70 factor (ECF subfamily)|nr:RNA polymerase sigma factor [Gemmatimonadaceae bacterium]
MLTRESASPDDAADVMLAAKGDRKAFERLYRLHVNRVFTLCTRMCGSRVRGEELTQDVFVRAWEKLPQFRGDAQFSTWIHRVAVNIVLTDRKNEARNRKRMVEEEPEREDTPLQRASVTPGYGDRMDITAAMETLPAGAKQIFVLHDIEGYKHEEIAEMCGITAGGSKAQLHRARLLLREALTR